MLGCPPSKKRCETIAKIVRASRLRLKDRETISNLAASPPLSLFLLPVIPAPRTPVSRISYRLYQPAQTKRAARNWVSHLLPDMIDKSLPSVISAKLLFRRAAAPSLPLLLLLIVLLTTGLPQPVSSFTAAVYGVSRTHRDKFYPRGNCTTSHTAGSPIFAEQKNLGRM